MKKIIKTKPTKTKRERVLEQELFVAKDKLARLTEEIGTANTERAQAIRFNNLASMEREELRSLLCMLWAGVEYEQPDLASRAAMVGKAFMFYEEAGTFQNSWVKFKATVQERFQLQQAELAVKFGTDLVITRTVGCSHCSYQFRLGLAHDVEQFPCPRCNAMLHF